MRDSDSDEPMDARAQWSSALRNFAVHPRRVRETDGYGLRHEEGTKKMLKKKRVVSHPTGY